MLFFQFWLLCPYLYLLILASDFGVPIKIENKALRCLWQTRTVPYKQFYEPPQYDWKNLVLKKNRKDKRAFHKL